MLFISMRKGRETGWDFGVVGVRNFFDFLLPPCLVRQNFENYGRYLSVFFSEKTTSILKPELSTI
ncbi:MAG: hypothetical protein ABIO24_06440, partial [Saprospiraceae bacterium]